MVPSTIHCICVGIIYSMIATQAESSVPTNQSTSITYIDCITRQSAPSDIGEGASTSIGCNDNEILTSCGFSAIAGTDYHNHPGSYVTNTVKTPFKSELCHAENYGQGVKAYARCCSFSALTDFACIGFHRGTDFREGQYTDSCSDTSYQYLTGCSALSSTASINTASLLGMTPGDIAPADATLNTDYPLTKQTCSSYDNHQSPPAGGSMPSLVCCNSSMYAFHCVARYGASTVKCADGYQMTGCSARVMNDPTDKNEPIALNGWYISDSDECIATSGVDVYAIAICCRLETDAPTLHPTGAPTPPTTALPTLYVGVLQPIKAPTKTPTIKIEGEIQEPYITTMVPTTTKAPDVEKNAAEKANEKLVIILWIMAALLILLVLLVFFTVLSKKKKKGTGQTATVLHTQQKQTNIIEMQTAAAQSIVPGETTVLQKLNSEAVYNNVENLPDIPDEAEDEDTDEETDSHDDLYIAGNDIAGETKGAGDVNDGVPTPLSPTEEKKEEEKPLVTEDLVIEEENDNTEDVEGEEEET